MNKGVWEGNNLIINPKILILGESHYEDENYGKEVSFSTSSVLNYYFDHRLQTCIGVCTFSLLF